MRSEYLPVVSRHCQRADEELRQPLLTIPGGPDLREICLVLEYLHPRPLESYVKLCQLGFGRLSLSDHIKTLLRCPRTNANLTLMLVRVTVMVSRLMVCA